MTDRSAAITFGRNPLDRRSESREDRESTAAAFAHPGARVLLFSADRVLLPPGGAPDGAHAFEAVRRMGVDPESTLLLGWRPDGAPVFAARLLGDPAEPPAGMTLIDVRSLAAEGHLDEEGYGPVAQARSMLGWHERHRFCANCGAPTDKAMGGYRRDCAACGAQHFPRVDPVAIMLVHRGDRVLLGRQARFKPGSYSCLAGFVEPGETIEDAVRREVREEAGVRVGAVRYLASQPWPFVSSLMIGCHAVAESEDIVMDANELEDCRWFARDEVAAMAAGTHPDGLSCPPRLAIARHLIEAWLSGG